MKRILVLYYTQSGQLKRIVHSVLEPLTTDPYFEVSFKEIHPEPEFPFPWTSAQFFDAFPECVLGIPSEVKSINIDGEYDLILLGYQPWFLSPSMPVQSFLASGQARNLILGKPIITLIGSRNMWLIGQEKMKKLILDLGGKIQGNIVFRDKHPNLVSLVTIIGWMFYNKKKRFLKILPESGVNDKDILEARKFGEMIKKAVISENFENLQDDLNKAKAVEVFPSLMLLEIRAIQSFTFFANFIRKKGTQGDPKRTGRVKLFQFLLSTLVFVVSPVVALASFFIMGFMKKSIRKKQLYFMSNSYSDNSF